MTNELDETAMKNLCVIRYHVQIEAVAGAGEHLEPSQMRPMAIPAAE